MYDTFEPSLALRRLLEQLALAEDGPTNAPRGGATANLQALAGRLRGAIETFQTAAETIAIERTRVWGLLDAVRAQSWSEAPHLAQRLEDAFFAALLGCDYLDGVLESWDVEQCHAAGELATDAQARVAEVQEAIHATCFSSPCAA